MTGSLPSRFISRRVPLIVLGLLVAVLLAAVTPFALPVGGSVQAQEAEPTGMLVVVPNTLQVGDTAEAVGFHVEPAGLEVSFGYSEHFVPTGETCETAEAGTTASVPSPTWIPLTACFAGQGRIQLLVADTGFIIAEATANIAEAPAGEGERAREAQQGCGLMYDQPCPPAPSISYSTSPSQPSQTYSITVTWGGRGYDRYRLSGDLGSYTGNSTSRTFSRPCGQSYDISVTGRGDNVDFAPIWSPSSSITVTTPECPTPITVMFGSDSYSVTEGSSRSIAVRLSRTPGLDVNIPVTVSPGSNVTVSFGGSQKSKTFRYTARQDSDCDDETVNLSFGDLPAGIVRGTPSTSRISITDDDSGPDCDGPEPITVMFGSDSYSVTEGSSRSIAVRLSRTPGKGVDIPVTVSPGSNVTVSFGGSQKSKTFRYTARQDSDCDDETVNLSFGDLPAGIVRGTPSTSRISITDDDSGPDCDGPEPITVMFGSDSYSVTEGSSRSIAVRLSSSPGKNVDIPVTVSPGSNVRLSFDGSQNSRSFTYTAPQDNDCNDEIVNLSFGDLPAGIVRGTPSTSRISITDDDGGPDCDGPEPITVMFGSDSYRVTEGSRRSITVNLSRSPGKNVDIPVTVSPGSNVTVSFGGSQKSRTFPYTAPQDSDCDDETVNLSFGDLPAGIVRGTPDTSRISITDNDTCRPVITVTSLDDSPVTEGASATFRIWANPAPRFNLSVNIDVTQTEDYLSGSTPSTATIPGSRYSDLSLPTEDDMVYEAHGSVRVEILQGSGYTVGGSSTATVEVMDNDPQQPQMLPSTTGDGTITLTWEWHDDVRATSYLVQQWFGEGSDPRFRTLPFDEYTISFSGTDKTRSATIEGLTNATSYTHRVISVNSAGQSPPTQIDTDLPLAAPTVNVTPLPDRRARLTWTEDPNASSFDVEVEEPVGTWQVIAENVTGSAGHPLSLDAIEIYDGGLGIVTFAEGLADRRSFKFRVTAKHATDSKYNNRSELIIIDTPITAANGHSPNGGQAELNWLKLEHADVLGDSSYRGGTYSFRYRKAGGNHAAYGWKPGHYVSDDTIKEQELGDGENPAINDTIEGLTKGAIYAIQLRYSKAGKPDVFAGRDVYVWPSDRPAANGERVATFPLNYPVPSKEYAYRVCEETFPGGYGTVDGNTVLRRPAWKKAVMHAFEQWDVATDGLITMTLVDQPCADYSQYASILEHRIYLALRGDVSDIDPSDGLSAEEIHSLRFFLNGLQGITLVRERDRDWNEVKMFDKGDYINLIRIPRNIEPPQDRDELLRTEFAFNQLAKEVGMPNCAYTANACAVPFLDYTERESFTLTTDIFLDQEAVGSNPPSLPGDDDTTDRSDVPFNRCSTSNNFAYQILVHEAGHALGIIDANDATDEDYIDDHPFTPDSRNSVMSYNIADELMCTPHPFDILAIYALYQSR